MTLAIIWAFGIGIVLGLLLGVFFMSAWTEKQIRAVSDGFFLRGGAVAARQPHKLEVPGSSPGPATNLEMKEWIRELTLQGFYTSTIAKRTGCSLQTVIAVQKEMDREEQIKKCRRPWHRHEGRFHQ